MSKISPLIRTALESIKMAHKNWPAQDAAQSHPQLSAQFQTLNLPQLSAAKDPAQLTKAVTSTVSSTKRSKLTTASSLSHRDSSPLSATRIQCPPQTRSTNSWHRESSRAANAQRIDPKLCLKQSSWLTRRCATRSMPVTRLLRASISRCASLTTCVNRVWVAWSEELRPAKSSNRNLRLTHTRSYRCPRRHQAVLTQWVPRRARNKHVGSSLSRSRTGGCLVTCHRVNQTALM